MTDFAEWSETELRRDQAWCQFLDVLTGRAGPATCPILEELAMFCPECTSTPTELCCHIKGKNTMCDCDCGETR